MYKILSNKTLEKKSRIDLQFFIFCCECASSSLSSEMFNFLVIMELTLLN